MEFGVQLFTVSKYLRDDAEKLFRNLSEMGYTIIEPCISLPPEEQKVNRASKKRAGPFLGIEEVDNVMKIAGEYGLHANSCHINGSIMSNVKFLESLKEKYNITQFIIGMARDMSEENIESYVEKYKDMSNAVKSFDGEILIHNGSREILTRVLGTTLLEAFLNRCDGAIGVQIDVGYVLYGGEDPEEYIKKVGKYVRSVHYKDIKPKFSDLSPMEACICLGKGLLDVRAIYNYTAGHGYTHIIDQDRSDSDILQDLKESILLLKSFSE